MAGGPGLNVSGKPLCPCVVRLLKLQKVCLDVLERSRRSGKSRPSGEAFSVIGAQRQFRELSLSCTHQTKESPKELFFC